MHCRPLISIQLLPVKIQNFSFHFNLLNLVEGRDLFDCHVDHASMINYDEQNYNIKISKLGLRLEAQFIKVESITWIHSNTLKSSAQKRLSFTKILNLKG